MSMRTQIEDTLIGLCAYGRSWWLPLVLLAVSVTNSLTGGMFIWCIGVTQATLYTIVVLSRPGIQGCIIGPLMLTLGSSVAAYTYIQLMQSGGADYVLEKTNLVGSEWLKTATTYGEKYGLLGLFGLQVSPVPVPTAILVVTGMLAKVDVWKIFVVVSGAKGIQLVLGAVLLQYTMENKTLEEVVLEKFGRIKNEEGAADAKDGDGAKAGEEVKKTN